MPPKKPDLSFMYYNSPYGGESLRAGAAEALARMEALIARLDPGARPREVELQIDEEQTEQLFLATRNQVQGGEDPEALWARHGGQDHPAAAEAARLLGPGEHALWAVGAAGHLWRRQWRLRGEEVEPRWPGLRSFLESQLSAPPIHSSWSGRLRGDAPDSPICLVVHWSLRLRDLNGHCPFPEEPDPYLRWVGSSHLIAFLRPRSSVILRLLAPYPQVSADFARWEELLQADLGMTLLDRRWEVARLKGGDPRAMHSTQGRYRRIDWQGSGPAAPEEQGPWDALVVELLGDRLRKEREWELRDQLKAHPLGPVSLAMVRGMAPLKGAALERGQWALRALVESAADRSPCEAAVAHLLSSPPSAAVSRRVGYALAPAFGERWLFDLIAEQLAARKPSSALLPLLENLIIHCDEKKDPLSKVGGLGQILRAVRSKAAETYRLPFLSVLTMVDDGRAWPTVLLEAATPPSGAQAEDWAGKILEIWCGEGRSRERVSDPAFLPWSPRLPLPGPIQRQDRLRWSLSLSEEERAELLAAEASWLVGA